MIQDGRSTKSGAEITRKEMKGPDRFQVAAEQAAEWGAKNRQILLAALAGAAALLVVAVVVQGVMRSSREKAGGQLFRALEAADGMVSTVPLPGVDRQIFKSDEDQQKAIADAADQVRKESPGTRAAVTAAVVAGQARLRLRQWDAAAAAFTEYLAAAPAGDSLRFAGLDGLARAQEGKGELEAAGKTFERVAAEAAFYRDRAALERARLLAKAGKAEEARKALQAFPEEFKESPLKAEAQEALARLGGK